MTVPPESPFCSYCGATLLTEKERKKVFEEVKKSNRQKRREVKIDNFLKKWYRFIVVGVVLGSFLLIGAWNFFEGKRDRNVQSTSVNTMDQSIQKPDMKRKTADSELSLDSVFLEERWPDVQRDLGRPNSSSQEPPNFTRYKYDDMEVVVENRDNTVQALVSTRPAVSTKRGIHQGDSLQAVLNAYGTNYTVSDYGEQTYYEYEYKTKSGESALLRFAVNRKDRVDYISIRTLTNDVNNAKKAFLSYHKAVSEHRRQDSFSYFTNNYRQAIGGYSSYVQSLQLLNSSSVSNIKVIDSSPSKVNLTYTWKVQEWIPSNRKYKTQVLNGQARMINDNGNWYIDNMTAEDVAEYIE